MRIPTHTLVWTAGVRANPLLGELGLPLDDRGRGVDDASSSHRGLGLGLAIARGFAEVNGGSLELVPREGGGTRARLSLPVHRLPVGVP